MFNINLIFLYFLIFLFNNYMEKSSLNHLVYINEIYLILEFYHQIVYFLFLKIYFILLKNDLLLFLLLLFHFLCNKINFILKFPNFHYYDSFLFFILNLMVLLIHNILGVDYFHFKFHIMKIL